jgi:hypothetical protein
MRTQTTKLHSNILLVLGSAALLILLAACGPNATAPTAPLPTVIEIPTEAPTDAEAVAAVLSPVSVETLTTPLASTVTPSPDAIQTDEATSEVTQEVRAAATDDTSAGGDPTITPSLTITNTITPLPTSTPVPTSAPGLMDAIVALALQATILPQEYIDISEITGGSGGTPGAVPTTDISTIPLPGATVPVGTTPIGGGVALTPVANTCAFTPAGGFGQIYANDPLLPAQLGCPIGAPPVNSVRTGVVQDFQFGFMVWVPDTSTNGLIYVFYVNGTYKRYPDTWVEGTDPESGGETPPQANLLEPVRGFGKVWRDNQDVRTALGWATAAERSAQITSLNFERGHMHYIDIRGSTFILIQSALDSGTWRQLVGAS